MDNIGSTYHISYSYNCKNNSYSEFGEFLVTGVKPIDGYKFQLGEEQWVMIRASGTEPVIRIYAEAENRERVISIINAVVNRISAG